MKSLLKNLDAIQITGFIISIAISSILLFRQEDTITSITLGVALAALIQLFDIQKRQSDSEERLLQANAISQVLYRDEWLLKHIRQILDGYELVNGTWFELFKRRASDAIIECRNVLHSMAEGRLTAGLRSPYTFGAEAFEQTERSIKAAASGDVGYWRSIYAQTYFRANSAAVQRGIKVVRVFIQPLTTLQGMVDILEQQRGAGIEVYVVQPEDLSRELNEDYLIMDDRVFVRLELTADGHAREETISIDEVEVERLVKKFDLLVKHARRLDDVIDNLKK